MWVYLFTEWWQPWANTLIYYQFNWNLNDSSWNNRNWTQWWTITYGTNYVNLTSWYVVMPNISLSKPTTINFWAKMTNTNSWIFFDSQTSSQQIFRVAYDLWQWDKFWSYTDIPSYQWVKDLLAPPDTNWHLFTLVAWNSWTSYFLDASLKATSAVRGSWTYTPIWIKLWTKATTNTVTNPWAYIWYFIIENKERIAGDISNYYNQTKSLYGIS